MAPTLLEEPLFTFWKNEGAADDTAETPLMRIEIQKYRMEYRRYRLGYEKGAKRDVSSVGKEDRDHEVSLAKPTLDKPIDNPLFQHLSPEKLAAINEYRESYRKYRLGYATGAKGEVADVFKRQISAAQTPKVEEGFSLERQLSETGPLPSEQPKLNWRPKKPGLGLCSHYSAVFATKDLSTDDKKEEDSLFYQMPKAILPDPSVPYIKLPGSMLELDASFLLAKTPLPKAAKEFSSIHVVQTQGTDSQIAAAKLRSSAAKVGKECQVHTWPHIDEDDVVGEYEALYALGSDLILQGANRATLLVFVGAGAPSEMALATILAMLPFRGIQLAYVTPSTEYVNPLELLTTPSGVFEYDATQSERMGRPPLAAVFGPLDSCQFQKPLAPWSPLRPSAHPSEKPAPFKIGALDLPMVTYEGPYEDGVERLADLLVSHFGSSLFPVVSVGETGDALGYGDDILGAIAAKGCPGFYFAHASGETNKSPEAFGKPELLRAIGAAKKAGKKVAVLAVGGGVNGNAIGMIAAMAGAAFIEVPTTLMHYNDATTSAKKAFSLVVDGQILSKNILGTFYLPQVVFCISETFLTLSTPSVHAAVGEACKTMGMLGIANSSTGQKDWHNILGGVEFASDFTKIVEKVDGFEQLIMFLRNTSGMKARAIALGEELSAMRWERASFGQMMNVARLRGELLTQLRKDFHTRLPTESRSAIIDFLTVINTEIIGAKAMFLAYSDPFEKYRALLFEYAHTLGHGVEAFLNGLYHKCTSEGVDFSQAFRLHGQCVGMAVLWAGEMSKEQNLLKDDGYLAHQGLIYTFNRFGGFDFLPCRALCDSMNVSKEEFCEGVLDVVRRDNKRGYCKCAADASVDQLVRERPGCLLRSEDPDAELRYLVEVTEKSQREVLERAFDGEFDKMAIASGDGIKLVMRKDASAPGTDAGSLKTAGLLRKLIQSLYSK